MSRTLMLSEKNKLEVLGERGGLRKREGEEPAARGVNLKSFSRQTPSQRRVGGRFLLP